MRPVRYARFCAVACVAMVLAAAMGARAAPYYPDTQWEQRQPGALGMDADGLAQAVTFAQEHEIGWMRDLGAQIAKDVSGEPYPEILGEVKERGGPSGVIVRGGYRIAQWGDVDRADMSFSLAKSYLSALAGLAEDRGLIPDLRDPVWRTVRDRGFDSAHNSAITWQMLLNQTSEWEGTLWGKPDIADRRQGYDRRLRVPGTFWEYNDVRVNRLALSLLRVWGKPLPEVLREEIMDPIGATRTWTWTGYRNSYIELNGRAVQSVSGGSHWGGGLWASTLDHARFGLLMLRKGEWNGRRILSERWVRAATRPADIAPYYGYLWWLNTGRRVVASAPASSFFALGSGGNVIWIDPEHDLVVVARWLTFDALDGFARRVLDAIRDAGTASR